MKPASKVLTQYLPTPQQEVQHEADETVRMKNAAPGSTLIGECIKGQHPTRQGRVLVRYEIDGDVSDRWLPRLMHVVVRDHDRVLIVWPDNAVEPIVTGVFDGFARRPEPRRDALPTVELAKDQRLLVLSREGNELLEVWESDDGPVVRVLHRDSELKCKGKLTVSAEEIEMKATRGDINIQASHDTNIKGETINLN